MNDTPEKKGATKYPYNGEKITVCRKCSAEIFFVKMPSGKFMPVNLKTEESHFIDCPAAKKFRRKE